MYHRKPMIIEKLQIDRTEVDDEPIRPPHRAVNSDHPLIPAIFPTFGG